MLIWKKLFSPQLLDVIYGLDLFEANCKKIYIVSFMIWFRMFAYSFDYMSMYFYNINIACCLYL